MSKVTDRAINYIEIPCTDMIKTKRFFSQWLAWSLTDYGDEYCAFNDGQLNGGFKLVEAPVAQGNNTTLLVFYSQDLAASLLEVTKLGASISQAIFSFPGGQRFHFTLPYCGEFAVWGDNDSNEAE